MSSLTCKFRRSGVLDPESKIRPLIDLLFDPEYWPNIEYFSNSEAGSSYLPKLAYLTKSLEFLGSIFSRFSQKSSSKSDMSAKTSNDYIAGNGMSSKKSVTLTWHVMFHTPWLFTVRIRAWANPAKKLVNMYIQNHKQAIKIPIIQHS